jgi:2-hydroxychromene-2-carboxylate isomerase
MPRTIDYFYAVISPFTYLGAQRFYDMADRQGAKIVHKPVKLGAVFAVSGGVPLPQRPQQRQDYRLVELQRISKRFGLPLNLHPRHFPADDRIAAGAVIAAQKAGQDVNELALGLMRAVWAEELNVSDPATVTAIADRYGFEGSKIVAEAESPDVVAILDANTQEAIDLGIFGSPSYVFNGEIFWGQDRIEYLEDAVSAAKHGE